MKIKFIFLFATGLIFLGCNSASNETTHVQKDTLITEEEQQHHHQKQEVIMLDSGKKWVVVPAMIKYIRNIESGVAEFSKKENPDFNAYKNLAKLIDKNLESLTSNCTMTGKAHDELHKWLVPFLDLSEEFSKSKNVEEAKKYFQKINESFNEFNKYFE